MVAGFVAELQLPVSHARLEAYRPGGGSDIEMVINYLWNIELNKALYPCLQVLEVSLRNSIHTAATVHYGTPNWFDQPDVLLEGQVEKIMEAREKLTRAARPHTADDIVAALTFGFWVALFNSPYELPLPPAPSNRLTWFDARSRPSALFQAAFPSAPNRVLSRKAISRRCNKVLWLRNRVFHHEPIWKYASLPQYHTEILEAIGWISPAMHTTIALIDDFSTVYDHGRTTVETKLKLFLGITEEIP